MRPRSKNWVKKPKPELKEIEFSYCKDKKQELFKFQKNIYDLAVSSLKGIQSSLDVFLKPFPVKIAINHFH